MNIIDIKDKIKNYIPRLVDEENSFSVLIPLIEINGELNFIFEVRSSKISQGGEISFPGGRIEKCEKPSVAAIRETCEELNIFINNIDLVQELDFSSTKSGAFVHTFLGYIKNIKAEDIVFNEDEVSEIFFVPLTYFLENEPERYFINYYPQPDKDFPYDMISKGKDYNWENIRQPLYFYKYKEYIIWGLTARIVLSFIKKIKNSNECQ